MGWHSKVHWGNIVTMPYFPAIGWTDAVHPDHPRCCSTIWICVWSNQQRTYIFQVLPKSVWGFWVTVE